MLENPDFIAWAAENAVLVVGHEGSSHKADKARDSSAGKDDKDGTDAPPAGEPESAVTDGCSLYPGLTCAEHEKIHEDAKTTGVPKLEFQGWPTSFMIGPDGTLEKHPTDRAPKTCMDALIAYQKKFKVKIAGKKYLAYVATVSDGDKAVEAGKWKDALAAYAKIDAEGKKLSALRSELPARIEALNAKVAAAFAATTDGDGDATAKHKAIQALRAGVAAKLSSGALPVVADLDAWLKANPAPLATK